MTSLNVRIVSNVAGISAHAHTDPSAEESIFVEFYNNGNGSAVTFPQPLVLVPEGTGKVTSMGKDRTEYKIPVNFSEIEIIITEEKNLLMATITIDPGAEESMIKQHILCDLS